MESCSKIKNGNGRLALVEVEVQRIWKEHFEDLYRYLGIERTEVEVRMEKLQVRMRLQEK